MVKNLLTKKAKISAEELRISTLTNEHSAHFKVILSHQIHKKFNFNSVFEKKGVKTSSSDLMNIFKAFGRFIDDSVRLTMTEVESKYGRKLDRGDGTFDPESGTKVQVEHLCLFDKEALPNGKSDSVRIHGYSRTNGGYFVITRLDWFHGVHKITRK